MVIHTRPLVIPLKIVNPYRGEGLIQLTRFFYPHRFLILIRSSGAAYRTTRAAYSAGYLELQPELFYGQIQGLVAVGSRCYNVGCDIVRHPFIHIAYADGYVYILMNLARS